MRVVNTGVVHIHRTSFVQLTQVLVRHHTSNLGYSPPVMPAVRFTEVLPGEHSDLDIGNREWIDFLRRRCAT
jgi:hypothetical protein